MPYLLAEEERSSMFFWDTTFKFPPRQTLLLFKVQLRVRHHVNNRFLGLPVKKLSKLSIATNDLVTNHAHLGTEMFANQIIYPNLKVLEIRESKVGDLSKLRDIF